MADEHKHHPANPEMEFEHQDMSPGNVYSFLIALAIGCVLVAVALWGAYHSLDAYARRHQPKQSPIAPPALADTRTVVPSEVTNFPQPRLETNERLEINDFRLKEQQTLDTYGWVDQKTGVAHIPIERAMQLIVQRGLPTTPKTGVAPTSAVGVVEQAAQQADTSAVSKGKKK